MFHVKDRVEIISDGRIGTINNIESHANAVNIHGPVVVVDKCLVRFDHDITKKEGFKPEQLRLVK